jgi:predicted nucleic acid-binding protein
MQKHKIFLDSDIILDVLAMRTPHYLDSAAVLTLIENKKIAGFTSPLVFANIYYILKKLKSRKYAIQNLRKLRILINIVPMNQSHIDHALNSRFTDFEDALQHFSAKSQEMNFIITRNKKDFKHSIIPACTPTEFLALAVIR